MKQEDKQGRNEGSREEGNKEDGEKENEDGYEETKDELRKKVKKIIRHETTEEVKKGKGRR